jgi:hypothetical protein
VFKPTSVVEAKGSIQRKVTYDPQPFEDKPRSMRSVRGWRRYDFSRGLYRSLTARPCLQVTPRADAPQWANNNPASARREICGRAFFNVPPEGPVKADRKYTQEFVRHSMEVYQSGRRRADAGNNKAVRGGDAR